MEVLIAIVVSLAVGFFAGRITKKAPTKTSKNSDGGGGGGKRPYKY